MIQHSSGATNVVSFQNFNLFCGENFFLINFEFWNETLQTNRNFVLPSMINYKAQIPFVLINFFFFLQLGCELTAIMPKEIVAICLLIIEEKATKHKL